MTLAVPRYGYRLADVGPHPNPSKAAAGQRLHRLDPDPVTAPVVERIFTMFGVDELGLRAIAEALTNEGIPSPSAYDPARNRHRNPSGWSHSAVRAILVNPTYRGTRVWGKQERFESLVDPDDVAAGNQTRMRWRDQDSWIRPDGQTHPALVSAELAALVAGRFGSRSAGTPRARSSNRPYALRGIIYCSRCGSRLQGSYRPSRSDRPGRVLYRCEIRRTRALPGELADHPSTLYVNEAAVLEPLDAWIESFSDPAWLAESQTADPACAARLSGMRAQLADLDRRIANLVDAVETGADPGPIMRQLCQRTAERDALAVRMAIAARPGTLSGTQIEAITAELGGISEALQHATTEERAAIYASLDVRLEYDDRSHEVRATSNLARVANRVGGGIATRCPRRFSGRNWR